MSFSAVYSRSLRFGRAPEEAFPSFSQKQKEDGGSWAPNNTSDRVFADFLEDHGDPRHLIVRRDLDIRDLAEPEEKAGPVDEQWQQLASKDFTNRTGKQPGSHPVGTILRPESDPSLTIYPRHSKAGKVVGYQVSWMPANSSHYHGFLHPEEFDHLSRELGLPYSTQQIEAEHKARR